MDIVQNSSGNNLDFKMNICYQYSSKENKCQKYLCFFEIRVLPLYVLTCVLLNDDCDTVPITFFGEFIMNLVSFIIQFEVSLLLYSL